jgi:hypothetical protein
VIATLPEAAVFYVMARRKGQPTVLMHSILRVSISVNTQLYQAVVPVCGVWMMGDKPRRGMALSQLLQERWYVTVSNLDL